MFVGGGNGEEGEEGVVQPIDGNLGNTAEVTYRGITRGNALKKSVKGEGVDRRVASIGASSCTHDNMIRVHVYTVDTRIRLQKRFYFSFLFFFFEAGKVLVWIFGARVSWRIEDRRGRYIRRRNFFRSFESE